MAQVEINEGALNAFLDEFWEQDVERRAFNVENKAKRLLSMHGGGRLYTRRFWRDAHGRLRLGGRRVPHQASAPGQPPAADTGLLRASAHHEIVGAGQEAEGRIGTDVAHGLYTEMGTVHMAPRPWLRPALYSEADSYGGLTNAQGEEYF